MLSLTLTKGECVTLELPDGRLVTMKFLHKPRSNVVRFGFDCPDDIVIERVPATREGHYDGGQVIDDQRVVGVEPISQEALDA